MPEGPSIVILREQVARFTGQVILRAEGNSKIDKDRLAGQPVDAFRSWGKHFLVQLPDRALRVHFLMFGSYTIDQRKPREARLSLGFANGELNLYSCAIRVIEEPLDDVYEWGADVMSDDWSPRRALRTQADACVPRRDGPEDVLLRALPEAVRPGDQARQGIAAAMIYVGTAGWSLYKAAEAFPGGGTSLERYATALRGVEINSSFYRSHARPMPCSRPARSVASRPIRSCCLEPPSRAGQVAAPALIAADHDRRQAAPGRTMAGFGSNQAERPRSLTQAAPPREHTQ